MTQVGAPPLCQRAAFPCLATRLAGGGHRVKPPAPLAGRGIIGVDKTAIAELPVGDAGHHHPIDRQGCPRYAVAARILGDRDVPKNLAGAGIQSNQVRIQGADENAVPQQCHAAIYRGRSTGGVATADRAYTTRARGPLRRRARGRNSAVR